MGFLKNITFILGIKSICNKHRQISQLFCLFIACFLNTTFNKKMFSTFKQLKVKTKLPQAQNIWSWFPCVSKWLYIYRTSCTYLLFSFRSKSLTTDLDSNQRNLNKCVTNINSTMLNLKFEKKNNFLFWFNIYMILLYALNNILTRFDKICWNNRTRTKNSKLSHQILILCV